MLILYIFSDIKERQIIMYSNLINKYIARRKKITQLNNYQSNDIDYQKACIASQTIKLITQKTNYKWFKKYSLRDRIVQTINAKNNYSKEAKQSILQLFNQGIKRESLIYTQQRVIFAQINKKVAFCPNYLITNKVFHYILGQKNPSNIMQGHFGISKTFSFILYTQLSNHIVNYLIKYQKDYKDNQKEISSQNLLKKSQNFTRRVITNKKSFIPNLLNRKLFFAVISKKFDLDQNNYVKQYKITKVNRLMKSVKVICKNRSKRPHSAPSDSNIENQNQQCKIKYLLKYVKVKNNFKYKPKIILVPKIIYWSLNIEDISQQNLYDILKNQFKQTSTKLNNLDQCLAACRNYRRYSIQTIAVIDQINLLASDMKENARKLLELKSKQIYNITQQKQINKREEKNFQIIKLIKKVGSYANYRIQLSSIHMQESIILSIAKSRHQQQLITKRMVINFVRQLKQERSIFELVDYFIFQLGNRLQTPKIPGFQQNWHLSTTYKAILLKKQIRNSIYQTIKNWKSNKHNLFYLSPLHIRSFFMLDSQLSSSKQKKFMHKVNLNENLKKFKSIRNVQIFINQCTKLIKNIVIQSNQWFQQKLHNFLYPDDKAIRKFRISMASQFYYKAIINITNNKSKQFISLKFEDIPHVKQQIERIKAEFQHQKQKQKYNLKLHNLKNLLTNKNMFDLIEGQTQIVTRFTSDFIQLIFDKCLYAIILFMHNNKEFQQFRLNKFDGPILERSFYDTLTVGNINLTIRKNQDQNLVQADKISSKKYPFISLPLIQNVKQKINKQQAKQTPRKTLAIENYKFLEELQQTLNRMINQKAYNAVLLPVHRDFKQILLDLDIRQNFIDHQSIAIDLIITNIDQKAKNITLIAIDVTRSLNFEIVKDKLIKFLKYYSLFTDKHKKTIILNDIKYSINLKYFVLGPKSTQFQSQFQLTSHINQNLNEQNNIAAMYDKAKNIQTNNSKQNIQYKKSTKLQNYRIDENFEIINRTSYMNYYINNNQKQYLLTQVGNIFIETALQIDLINKEAKQSEAEKVFKILKDKIIQQTLKRR